MTKGILAVSVLFAVWASAYADSVVDLRRFYADPEVSFSLDGHQATFAESAGHMQTALSDDPGLGDPALIFAGPGATVQFIYEFSEGGDGNLDQFGAWIIDPLTGWSIGDPYEFCLNASGSGTISWDLSALGLTGPWGIQFQLTSLPGDLGANSTLRISELEIVPEPVTTLGLIGLLAGILGARHLRQG